MPASGTPTGNTPTGGTPTTCNTSVTPDDWARLVDESSYQRLPTQAEADCYVTDLVRVPLPAFMKGTNAGSEWPTRVNLVRLNLANWDTLAAVYGGNLAPFLYVSLPPFANDQGVELLSPMAEPYRSQRLALATIMMARQKKKTGKPLVFANAYPPTQQATVFETKEAFRNWIVTQYLPEKIAEAKIAEKAKVEAFAPFPVEFEVLMRFQTKLFGSQGALTESEQLAFAQELIDLIASTVRPHFTGQLVANSYFNYVNLGTAWNRLNFSAYDVIAFTLFPSCQAVSVRGPVPAQLAEYFDTQLANIQIIVRNSGGKRWYVAELFARPFALDACGYGTNAAFDMLEDDIYRIAFEKLDALPASAGLSGMFVDEPYLRTAAARARVKAYFARH